MSRAVILFKSPPRNPAADPYVIALTSPEYTPYFVEVLETNFVNEENLLKILQAGPERDGWNGVAITSSRSAEAWIQAVSRSMEPGEL